MKSAPDYWYNPSQKVPIINRLLAKFYALISTARKNYYHRYASAVYNAPVPVIVVGNLTVGGTGKTPVVIALLEFLKNKGYQPGVISRGYGGKAEVYPLLVTAQSESAKAGDEPVLIAFRTAAPVVVDPKRKRGIRHLLQENPQVDVIISDDGLQHYAMGRDVEIVIIDGIRRFGNEQLLPAGPLRESIQRKQQVDFCFSNGGDAQANELSMQLELGNCYLLSGKEHKTLKSFKGQKVHAVAGIGNPQRFFDALTEQGLQVHCHTFPDHHLFKQSELEFNDGLPVLITEKDAVKCRMFKLDNVWVVPAKAILPDIFYTKFLQKLRKIEKG